MISSSSWIWSTKIFPFLVHFQIFPFLTHKEWSDLVVTYLEMIVTSFRVEWRIVWHDWPSSLKVRIFPFSKKIFPFFKKFPKKNFWKKNFPFFEKKNFKIFPFWNFWKIFPFFPFRLRITSWTGTNARPNNFLYIEKIGYLKLDRFTSRVLIQSGSNLPQNDQRVPFWGIFSLFGAIGPLV